MELTDIRTFLAVCSERGFTSAARKLNCVQPNVTARIKKLEEELGVQLFYRSKNHVTLTSFGQQFHQYATRIVQLSRDALLAVRNEIGPLTIGVTQTVASAYLPKILHSYHTKYRGADITVRTVLGKGLINDLLGHLVDYMLVEIPVSHSDLVTEHWWSQKLVVVTAPNYPLTGDAVTSLSFSSKCPYRRAMIDAFSFLGIAPRRDLKLLNVDTILASAMGGVGVTVLPMSLVDREHIAPFVAVYDFPHSDDIATVNLMYNRNSLITPQMAAFSQVVRETMVKFSGIQDCGGMVRVESGTAHLGDCCGK